MNDFKSLKILGENYTIGSRVAAFSHQQCTKCHTWFRFSYDQALSDIKSNDYFEVACPECEHIHYYSESYHIPHEHVVFKELD